MTTKTQDKPEGPLIRMGPSSAHPVGILSLCASNLADPHISTAFPGAALTLPTVSTGTAHACLSQDIPEAEGH